MKLPYFSQRNNFVSTKCVFAKEKVHNVTSSNKPSTSKGSTDISYTKEPVRDQITSSQHLTVPSISSNQEHSKEPIRDRIIKTNRPKAPTTNIVNYELPLSETPGSEKFLVTNYQDNSTKNTTL